MLKVEALHCSLGNKQILKSVSLELKSGQILGLVGPNGSGKSTLLRCILDLLPAQGKLLLNDRPISEQTRREIAQAIGYVPQVVGALPSFSVQHFVELGSYPNPLASKRKETVVMKALEQTDTGHLAKRLISTLSGGERQRVLLAAALAGEPALILLDEPASFLDPAHEVALYKTLSSLREESNLGICLVSHNINGVTKVANRILALKEGEVAFEGSSTVFLSADILEDIYSTPFKVIDNFAFPRHE